MSDLIFRQELQGKLEDAILDLNFERSFFTHGSGVYKNLSKAIKDVLGFIKSHEGEEWLEEDDKKDLEDKIRVMREAARAYMDDKLAKGALAYGRVPLWIRRRYRGAFSVFRTPSKVVEDSNDLLAWYNEDEIPKMKEKEYKRWGENYKAKVRYTAKKQLFTYEKKLQQLNSSVYGTDELTKEEFAALMDFLEPDKILTYRDDAELCQKYPNLRIKLEMAIRAKEKLEKTDEYTIRIFLEKWGDDAVNNAVDAARKAKEKKKQKFTDKDKKAVVDKIRLFVDDTQKKYLRTEDIIEKGDVLEQVARFLDLKMKVISNKRYIKLLHTNSFGQFYSVKDYEKKIKECKNEKDKEFYRYLRDIRELQSCGIKHVKEPYEKVYYKEVNETLYTTTKKEMFGFHLNDYGFQGVTASNNLIDAVDSSSTYHTVRYGNSGKASVGKIGYKLHSPHKTLSASGGLVFGQVKAGKSFGGSYVSPGLDLQADGEATSAKLRGKIKLDSKYVKANVRGSVSAGYSNAYAKAGIGNFTPTVGENAGQNLTGAYVQAGYTVSAYKGEVGGSLNIFGLSFSISLTGYGAGYGGNFCAGFATGGAMFSFAGCLGIGAGLAINVNWSGLYDNIRKIWSESKLKKLIKKYKADKKAKASSLEASNPEKGKGSEDKKMVADADDSFDDIDNINNDVIDLSAEEDEIDTSSKKKDNEVDKKGDKKPEREEIPIRDEELYFINQGQNEPIQNEPIQKKPTNKSHTPKSKMHL